MEHLTIKSKIVDCELTDSGYIPCDHPVVILDPAQGVVSCQLTELGYIPCDDLVTIDRLLCVMASVDAAHLVLWDALNDMRDILMKVVDQILPVDDSYR